MRQQVHAFIDQETYLMLKAQNVNISSMIRNALRTAVDVDISEEEEELQTKIQQNKEEISAKNKELAEDTMKLAIIRERKKQEQDRTMKEMIAYGKSIREAGVLNFDM